MWARRPASTTAPPTIRSRSPDPRVWLERYVSWLAGALGTSFSVGYFLTGLATLLVSTVMLRSSLFSRLTGVAGVAAGVTGLLPATMGTLGFVLSFVSLIPLIIWLFLVGQRFSNCNCTSNSNFPRLLGATSAETLWRDLSSRAL